MARRAVNDPVIKVVNVGRQRAVLEVRRTGTFDWVDGSADAWAIPLMILCGTANFVSWRIHRRGWTLRVKTDNHVVTKTRYPAYADALTAQLAEADRMSSTT